MCGSPWAVSRSSRGVLTKLKKYCAVEAATIENFRAAAEAELADAQPLEHNAFKVELAKRTITAVLQQLAEETA